MPRGDGTGPWGMGSMTGRGAGFCGGFGMPGDANPVPGRGAWGWGGGGGRGRGRGLRGGGWGRRNMYWATGLPGWARFGPSFGPGAAAPGYGAGMSKVEEMEVLKQQAEYFKAGLEDIEKRLQTLESSDE
jgi:hypothetical protein